MLVMYTLKGTIAQTLPATSYTKFIDIWLLYGVLMPFLILIVIILMEHLPDKSQVTQYSISNLSLISAVSSDNSDNPGGEQE